ncbi:MAG: hypothetical protein ACE5I7_07140 [Candidatus Binatia bacterium]
MRGSDLSRCVSAVLAVLALGLSVPPGAVLCIGSDGHQAIEPAGAWCCQSQPGAPSDGRRPATRCAPECTDTTIGVATALPSDGSGWLAARTLHLRALPVATHVAYAPSTSINAVVQPDHASPRPPRAQRTALQLC